MAIFLLVAAALFGGCGNDSGAPVSEDQTPASTLSISSDSQAAPPPTEQKPDLPINSEGATDIAVNYLKEQYDSTGDADEETQAIVQRLWYLANAIYNVEDYNFSVDADKPDQAPDWPSAMKFVDFDTLTAHVFTQNGKQQLLSAEIGGAPYIYADNGVYYHLGAWKTNALYEEMFKDYKVTDSTDTSMVLEISYSWKDTQGNPIEDRSVSMTIVKEDGQWLVDSYLFPDAQYPNL